MKRSLSFSVSSIARNLILLFLIAHSSFLTAQPCGAPVPYNGYTYNTVQVGSYCWMIDNLRTTVDAAGNPIAVALIYYSNMHPDTVANLAAFGRLYSWYSAVGLPEGSTQKPTVNAAGYVQGICPDGWYLPTQEAFDELHAFAIEALCSDNPAYWLGHVMNNSTDLSFVPGGYYQPNSSMYNHLLGDAYYWISDTTLSTTKPMCHILYGCPVLELATVNAHTGYSVRCVQKIDTNLITPIPACPSCVGETTVTDIDGNIYQAKTMPDGKMWMIENLRTTKYANGTEIREWINQWYANGDTSYYYPYFVMPSKANSGAFTSDKDTLWGYYYNWAAAVGAPKDTAGNSATWSPTVNTNGHVQGVCPTGWHLPSQDESDALLDSVYKKISPEDSSAIYMSCPSGWLASSLLATNTTPNRNYTCFSAVPAGNYTTGSIKPHSVIVSFWSSTSKNVSDAHLYYLRFNIKSVSRYDTDKHIGISVRCVRDDAPPSTVDITCPFSGDTSVIQNVGANYEHSGTGWDATTTVAGATLSYTLSGATTGSGTTLNNVTFNPGTTTVKWKATLGEKADSCSFRVNVATNIPACPACTGDTTVTDIDGNVYQAKTMPDGKVWMIENLRTTKYANGDTIRKRTNEWASGEEDYKPYFVKPSQATPDGGGSFTSDKDTLWGYYYNWAAAVGAPKDTAANSATWSPITDANGYVQGICPAGWHLPSQVEWNVLLDTVYKKISTEDSSAIYMSCSSGWQSGLLANNVSPNRNYTCFSAVPAGYYFFGTVLNSGSLAYFWSGTPHENLTNGAYYYDFYCNYRRVNRYIYGKYCGYSVRCVRD